MEKQTAVEFLIEMTSKLGYVSADIAEQAKEMEKQERENSYSDGWNDCEKWFAEKELHEKFGGADII